MKRSGWAHEHDLPHSRSEGPSAPQRQCRTSLYTEIDVGFSAFCINSETTYRYIDDVVGEIAAMTPGPLFHVGGDEMKTLAAADYVAFINRVQQIVRSHGKQAIGWDEGSSVDLLPTTIVQHWVPTRRRQRS